MASESNTAAKTLVVTTHINPPIAGTSLNPDEVLLSQDIIYGWKARIVELSGIMRAAQHETKLLQRKIEAARVLIKTKDVTNAE